MNPFNPSRPTSISTKFKLFLTELQAKFLQENHAYVARSQSTVEALDNRLPIILYVIYKYVYNRYNFTTWN